MSVLERIRQVLSAQGVSYELLEHEPVTTSEEAARVRGVPLRTGAKAMVLKTKEGFLLAVFPANRRINFKRLRGVLGARRLRLATPEEVETITGLTKGAIPPLGNLFGLPTYMDPALLEEEFIYFNAGSHTHSVRMRSADLLRLVQPTVTSFTDPP